MSNGSKGWKDPSKGSEKKREDMPATCFLDTKNRRYPYKKKSGGKWVPSRSGLMAAKSRAAGQHEQSLVAKADRLLKKYFNYTPEK